MILDFVVVSLLSVVTLVFKNPAPVLPSARQSLVLLSIAFAHTRWSKTTSLYSTPNRKEMTNLLFSHPLSISSNMSVCYLFSTHESLRPRK